jgi:large subunit ribosomal protein L4
MELSVYNIKGDVVGTQVLDEAIFGIEPNQHVLAQAVVLYNANSRQATAKTKVRSEVRGGGKKPFKQKGTGRARAGSTRAPQWRGGGTVFGPTGVQNFKLKMNKKVRQLALKSALSEIVANEQVKLVDKIVLPEHKTKLFLDVLKALQLEGKTLFVYAEPDETDFDDNAWIASNNLQQIFVLGVDQINVYDLLNAKNVVFTQQAILAIQEHDTVEEEVEEEVENG